MQNGITRVQCAFSLRIGSIGNTFASRIFVPHGIRTQVTEKFGDGILSKLLITSDEIQYFVPQDRAQQL